MNRKMFYIVFGLALAFTLVVIAPVARADAWDQASQLTFNQPVEIPGNVVLPAGIYWFVLPSDAGYQPDFVQVFNADRTRLLATVETVPTSRMTSTDHTELTFAEQPQKWPAALISWFYPGLTEGHEFVYSPREEAQLSEDPQITLMAQTAS